MKPTYYVHPLATEVAFPHRKTVLENSDRIPNPFNTHKEALDWIEHQGTQNVKYTILEVFEGSN